MRLKTWRGPRLSKLPPAVHGPVVRQADHGQLPLALIRESSVQDSFGRDVLRPSSRLESPGTWRLSLPVSGSRNLNPFFRSLPCRNDTATRAIGETIDDDAVVMPEWFGGGNHCHHANG